MEITTFRYIYKSLKSTFNYYVIKMRRIMYYFTFTTIRSWIESLTVDVDSVDHFGLGEKGHDFFHQLHVVVICTKKIGFAQPAEVKGHHGESKDNRVEVCHKVKPFTIREQKKVRVASPKSKVQQRINTQKK